MAPQMKGLTQFIVDLRNSHDVEEERRRINVEIDNIQQKFTAGLNSYQRKKYVCKLIYMHLLGFTKEVQFGLDQLLELVRSADYSEKQLGYLSVLVLISRETGTLSDFISDLLDHIQLELMLDLRSNSEEVNCLALQFIALNFNFYPQSDSANSEPLVSDGHPDSHTWRELLDLVYSLCVSPIARPITKKRALAALNVMARLYPQIILANDNWVPRLLTLVDETDLGVVMASVPLVRTLTDILPHYAKSIVPSITNRLYTLVVDQSCPEEYFYYEVPAPWLIINLIQLIEQYFLPLEHSNAPQLTTAALDSHTVGRLRQVVSHSIQIASKPVMGQQSRNSQSAVLFQAVSLATFLDASPEAIDGAIQALLVLLESLETNTRYLVLDALVKLLARTKYTLYFKDNLNKLFKYLHDKDSSVRKKTVDLLFTICDPMTFTQIISKLLDYYPLADSALKTEVAVKIAVLAEQFATDSIWYVSTMLRLLALGGLSSKSSETGGEVWERITQIVVNNEELHIQASKYVMNLLRKTEDRSLPENLVKAAAFVLGEFGYKLVEKDDNSQFSAVSQFQVLYEAYFRVPLSTRPLMLTTFLKFIYRFPTEEFVPDILDLFEAEVQSLDLEIQTRAFEYLKVASFLVSGDHVQKSFAESLVQAMPPFESKKNALMNQLGSVKLVSGKSNSTINVSKVPTHTVTETAYKKPPVPGRSSLPNSGLSDGLDEEEDPFGDVRQLPQLSPNWYPGYHRMLQYDAGIFYEDQLVKITYRTTKDGHNIHIKFTVINNAAKTANTAITAFTVREIHNGGKRENPSYVASLTVVPELTIQQKTTMDVEVKVRDVVENDESPVISITYKCSGSFNTLNLKIPIVLIKTLSGTSMSSLEDFKKRWLQIGELLGSVDGEKRGTLSAQYKHVSSNIVRVLQRVGFAIVHSSSDSDDGVLVMGAGILHTMKLNFGVLLTMKSLDQSGRLFDLTVRSTGGGVSEVIHETLSEVFET